MKRRFPAAFALSIACALRMCKVAGAALRDLGTALGPAGVSHHRGVADQPLEQRLVALAPRLDVHGHRPWNLSVGCGAVPADGPAMPLASRPMGACLEPE
jgi:hypothetical protein